MKYFVVTSTIKDGEYEYLQQTAIESSNEINAGAIVANEHHEWTKDDHREYEIDSIKECTAEEYETITKFIH